MQERLAIVDGIRTPFCKAGGALKDWQADDLGTFVLKELMARTDLPPTAVDEVIFGCIGQPVHAANVARVIGLKAGLPESIPAYTVARNCASGMESISTACYKIMAGAAEIVAVGGTESMSNSPLIYGKKMEGFFMRMMRAKTSWEKLATLLSFRPSFLKPIVSLEMGLTDPVSGLMMGKTAEILARDFGITRDEQDTYAMHSHHKAVAAWDAGRLTGEIVPVPTSPKYEQVQQQDEGPRRGQNMEALAKLKTIFDRNAGTVTAGNACQITDGAVAMLVMRESKARELGLKPLGYMRDHAYAGLEPQRMGLGPVYATHRLLDKTKLTLRDFDLFEINEAFATQVMGCVRALGSDTYAKEYLGRDKAIGEIPMDLVNVNGGAIALGHPVGATGARLVLTILKELRRRGKNRGLATLCVGGGQGAALALEVE